MTTSHSLSLYTEKFAISDGWDAGNENGRNRDEKAVYDVVFLKKTFFMKEQG